MEPLLLRMFALLDTPSKLRAAAVCTAWRKLRREPKLWCRLELTVPFFSSAGAVAFVTGDPRSPLPSASGVQELELRGGAFFELQTFDALLTACDAATSVTLNGNELSWQAAAVLAKPRAAPLQRLTLGHVSDGYDAGIALAEVLAASPSLTHLTCELISDTAWARALTPPTGGGVLALRHLHARTFVLEMLALLGAGAPHLTSLTVDTLIMNQTLAGAWALLTQLRELRIGTILHVTSRHDSFTIPLQPLLACVAGAAPNMRALHLSRGKQFFGATELAEGTPYTPLQSVGVGAGGIFSLRHLEELTLEDMHVCAADAAGADLPSLRNLTLRNCGAHAAAAAAALAAAAPALQSLTLGAVPAVELGSGAPGPGISGLAALSHAALRALSLTFMGSMDVADAAGAHEVKALAARNALPSLRSLDIGNHNVCGFSPLHPCFDAAHPWPVLRALAIRFMAIDNRLLAACMAGLRAPLLTAVSGLAEPVHKALRTSGYMPKLAPWCSPPPLNVMYYAR
jgi:hypothetical protein